MISTGVVAAAGDPWLSHSSSVPLIVYGIITEQSIGKLFLASIIPGFIVALFFVQLFMSGAASILLWAQGRKIIMEGKNSIP